MAVEIRPCTYDEAAAIPAFYVLVSAYADESATAGLPRPNGDADSYRMLEQAGLMQGFLAFEGGDLIGFANCLVSKLPHYGKKIATMESWFVGEGHRSSGAGFKLKAAVEAWAVDSGATGIFISAPIGSALAVVMSLLRNYNETHAVYFKALA